MWGGEQMTSVFRLYQEERLTDWELGSQTPFTVGSGKKDTITLPDAGLGKRHLTLEQTENGWQYKAARPVMQGGKECLTGVLAPGELLVLDAGRKIAAAVYETGPDDARMIDLSEQGGVLIGRDVSCEICIGSKLVSGKHLELLRTANGWLARDLGSTNGTYRNGLRMDEAELSVGDMLDIGLCRLILTGDRLSVSFAGMIKTGIAQAVAVRAADSPEAEYPWLFRCSPRLMEEPPTGEIEFESAPAIGGKPSVNWANVLVTPIASVLVMLGASLLLGGPMTMLYFSAPMALIGLVMSVLNYRKQRKDYGNTEQLRLQKYEEYLEKQEAEIKARQNEQRRILTGAHPVTADCISIASEPARRLWERRPADRDFMELRVGEGELPSCVGFRLPKQQLTLEEDALASHAQRLAGRYKTVSHCPITYHAGQSPTCGLIGDRNACLTLAKNIIVQATTHHSYEDMRIVCVFDPEERKDWEFARWLPHCYDDTRSKRYIVDSADSAKTVFAELEGVFSQRVRSGETEQKASGDQMPYYFFICASDTLLRRQSILSYLLSNDPSYNVGALFLYNQMDSLPKECAVILEVKDRKGRLYHRDNAAGRVEFAIDSVREGQYDAFARALAPIRIEAGGGKGSLPVALSFLQGYNARRPQEIDLVSRWPVARPEDSMAVPVGVKRNGEPFLFDIHEKACGPHGLVAGMTGSGKSEMVQSWILSMALRFPPEAVSFVLIDFKGTGLVLPFRNLPHLAGTISDLDTNITRNLIALENELNRRKALLDEHSVSSIGGYLKHYRQGKASVPLSYLFIVIDEFAEFKVQFPDFMQVVNRVFAIGRTLGVHMILLTQKPTSVVDDKMSANTRFRWCLKVASSADSKEMLHHPDAARITNPGRAFVQVGEDEIFEEIQSYWSGAPYNPHRDLSLQRSAKISVVNLYGQRKSYEPEKTTGFRAERNEIDAIVEYLDDHARTGEIPRARSIWESRMAAVITLDEVLQIAFDGERWSESESGLRPVVGMIDDPRTQSQYPFRLNLPQDGHAVIYGAPGTGKTTFLQSLIMALALSYPPDWVSLYLLDFGGGSLNLFRDLPHVGGVARDTEEEKVEKLCEMIGREIDRRKMLFSELGVVSIDSYREANNDRLPYMVLILDNFAPVLSLFPDLDAFFQTLTREGASFGVYLVATASTQNAVSYRISQNIREGIALRMPDKSDYASIVGRTDGMEPENLPGRGLLKGTPPLEFQTALPAAGESENQRVARMRELIALMGSKWSGARPQSVPVLPEQVYARDYQTKGLLIGLSTSSAEPVESDPATSPFLLISAQGEADLAGLMLALARQLPQKLPGARITMYDPVGAEPAGLEGWATECITDPSAFDEYIASLMPILQERKERADAGDREFSGLSEPLVIVLRDLGRFYEPAQNETVRRLGTIVNLGQGLGVYLLVGGQSEEIDRLNLAGDSFVMSMVAKAASILIGGSFSSHGAFDSNLGYTESAEPLADGIGYFVKQRIAQKIKPVQSDNRR